MPVRRRGRWSRACENVALAVAAVITVGVVAFPDAVGSVVRAVRRVRAAAVVAPPPVPSSVERDSEREALRRSAEIAGAAGDTLAEPDRGYRRRVGGAGTR